MQIFIGCLTVVIIYLILANAYKMLKKSSTYDKMEEIIDTEDVSSKVIDFSKKHKNHKKNKEAVKKFNKQ